MTPAAREFFNYMREGWKLYQRTMSWETYCRVSKVNARAYWWYQGEQTNFPIEGLSYLAESKRERKEDVMLENEDNLVLDWEEEEKRDDFCSHCGSAVCPGCANPLHKTYSLTRVLEPDELLEVLILFHNLYELRCLTPNFCATRFSLSEFCRSKQAPTLPDAGDNMRAVGAKLESFHLTFTLSQELTAHI